jgi:UDP-2,3-diacylglucosamine pyrophosphatase LpxH
VKKVVDPTDKVAQPMTVNPVPEFDELHVISDLHIGGIPGFQIFGSGDLLATFVDHLRARPTDRRVALVINGDMVDFLAEPNAHYFDPANAVAKLKRISEDQAFKPVWRALNEFVGTPNRQLVIVLGNHDLELSLPWVRDYLVSLLANNDAARGRVRLEFEGFGFQCGVGGSQVLCLHGNEVDTWNVTDYEMLRRIAREYVQGRPVASWTPNAGSKLVIDVMNGVKQTYAFVDLLKPEVQAVVPLLLALDQTSAARLRSVSLVASRLTWDAIRRATGFLSPDEEPAPTALAAGIPVPENGIAATASRAATTEPVDALALLRRVEVQYQGGGRPLSGNRNEMLGAMDALRAIARRKDRCEIVYEAIRDVAQDRTFTVTDPDATYKLVDKYVNKSFEWVLAGHTHLERVVARAEGGGTYINTGTWIPLIQLQPERLTSVSAFRPVFDILESSRTVSALSRMPGLIQQRPAVASIERDGGRASAQLRRVSLLNGQLQFKDVLS